VRLTSTLDLTMGIFSRLFGGKRAQGPAPVELMSAEWPFDQSENCAVVSVRQVMVADAPVLLVTHDEEDHGWQFLPGEEIQMADAVLVSFKSVLAKDPTLFEVADLPPGWRAHRVNSTSPWVRERVLSEAAGREV
jgi:hypothetical protein